MQKIRDFDIALITDVHIERGKIAISKFSETISETNMQMPHHFGLSIDTMELDIGKHHIIAKVTWPDGTIVTESADFTVTN